MTAPDRDSTPWDAPLRLDVAARLFFPDGSISASSLRKEAARGRLRVYRIAGKDMTTLNDVRDMVAECLARPSRPDCGSMTAAAGNPPNGSSLTEAGRSALDALRLRAQKLSQPSPATSPASTSRPPALVRPLRPLSPTS